MKKQKILFTFLSIASFYIVFSESKILWAQEQQIMEDLLKVQIDLSTARANLQAGNIYEAQTTIQEVQAVIANIGRVLALLPRPYKKK